MAYRHTPMVRNPEKFGMTIQKQDEYDMPLDYYYTLKEPGSLSCLDAMQLCEEFYQNDFEPWAVADQRPRADLPLHFTVRHEPVAANLCYPAQSCRSRA